MTATRDKNFEWYFANAFSMLLSENEVLLKCGITEDPTKKDEDILERVGLVLTPKAAKLLGHILSATMEQWEKANGVEIQLDLARIAERTSQVSKKVD